MFLLAKMCPIKLIGLTINSSECLLLVLALDFACEDCICVKKKINQHEDQKVVFGRKASHFEAYVTGIRYE